MEAKKVLTGGEFLVRDVEGEELFTPEEFSDEQREIAETTTQFVVEEILPQIDEIEAQNFDVTVGLMKRCGELGLLMIDSEEELGGLGLDKVTGVLVAEKIAPSGSFSVIYSAHSGLGTLPLLYYGTKDQIKRYLEKIITGEDIAAFCLTEPEAGSDALSPKTKAKLSDDGKFYILNGTKQFITNAHFAHFFTVFATVGEKAVTAFLLERDFEGLTIGPEEHKLGIKGSSTCQVILDGVKVPVENVLGEVGKGHKIALNILNLGRLKLGAAVTGAAKNAFGYGVRYGGERKQFGKKIVSFGAIKEKLADMTANIYASESVVYRAAGQIDARLQSLDRGSENFAKERQGAIADYSIECAISKVFCSEVLRGVVDEVVAIYGGYGYTKDYPAERFYRDERINRIFEGTNEINRLIITGMVLNKSVKGYLPLQKEALKAFDSLMTPTFEEPDRSLLFSEEKALLQNLKTLFLVIAGTAAQKFGEKLAVEEEILMAAADIIAQIYAFESVLLRAEKGFEKASEKRRQVLKAVVKVFAFKAAETVATAAKKATFYIEEGDTQTIILSGVRRFTKYDASGLLEAKRLLAGVAEEKSGYPF